MPLDDIRAQHARTFHPAGVTLVVAGDLDVDASTRLAEASFGCTVTGDTVVLPGIMSRKKQIIPALKL